MEEFTYRQPTAIHFGFGATAQLGKIAARYGKTAILVTCAPTDFMQEKYARAMKLLQEAGLTAVHYSGIGPNPLTSQIDEGIRIAHECNADVVIALGGGSAIDAAKLIALCARHGSADWPEFFAKYRGFRETYPLPFASKLPLIAVSTTAGTGSQCTQAAVVTDVRTGLKTTIQHQGMSAAECIVDPEQTMTMPFYMTACTAFDAFSHAFESYLGAFTSPLTRTMSLESIRMILATLPKLREENSPELRAKLSLADTYAGICLSNGAGNLPHPLGEMIGSICGICHGQTLAIVYPAFLRETWSQHVTQFAEVARIFDPALISLNDSAAAAVLSDIVADFLKEIGIYHPLSDFHATQEQMDTILNHPKWDTIRMADRATIQRILAASF